MYEYPLDLNGNSVYLRLMQSVFVARALGTEMDHWHEIYSALKDEEQPYTLISYSHIAYVDLWSKYKEGSKFHLNPQSWSLYTHIANLLVKPNFFFFAQYSLPRHVLFSKHLQSYCTPAARYESHCTHLRPTYPRDSVVSLCVTFSNSELI